MKESNLTLDYNQEFGDFYQSQPQLDSRCRSNILSRRRFPY